MIKKLLEDLTISDVVKIVSKYLGSGKPVEDQIDKGILKFQTVCHNSPGKGQHKLYYYHSTKLFRCYTECGETFNIFELVARSLNISFKEAFRLVREKVGSYPGKAGFFFEEEGWEKYSQFNNGFLDDSLLEQPEAQRIGEHNLKLFPDFQPKSWIEEDIGLKTMKKFEIKMSFMEQKIIIPHRDIDGDLIGIRGRNHSAWELMKGAKYTPIYVGGRMLNHPLGGNLYGINISKEYIENTKTAILFEGEKSVLKYDTYNNGLNNSVAVCGSSISNPQIKLLNSLGVKEVVIAFDKMFTDTKSIEAKKYKAKLIKLGLKFPPEINVYYIWDNKNLTSYKSSPIDHGKDIFNNLLKNKILIERKIVKEQ